jgi:HEAT repeat protein
MQDPVAYGQAAKDSIANYVEIANLALLPPEQAMPQLRKAIQSKDAVERYWGYSVCSIFGEQAAELTPFAENSVDQEANLLVRLRACEFLGLTQTSNPVPVIETILKESDSAVVNLIALQSLVFFKDGPSDYQVEIDLDSIKTIDAQVMRRVGYLMGIPEAQIKKRTKELMKRDRK